MKDEDSQFSTGEFVEVAGRYYERHHRAWPEFREELKSAECCRSCDLLLKLKEQCFAWTSPNGCPSGTYYKQRDPLYVDLKKVKELADSNKEQT